MKRKYNLIRLKIWLIILASVSNLSTLKAQHDDEDFRWFFHLSIDNFTNIQNNLESEIYSFAFNNMLNHNEFDFYSPKIKLGWGMGISIPFHEKWTYEIGYQLAGATSKISYLDSNSNEIDRYLKFRSMNFNLIGINHLFGSKHSVGVYLPLTTGRLLYKSKGIEGVSDSYETISKTIFISHFLSIDADLHYQYNLHKNLAIRFSKSFNIFGGDLMVGDFGMIYLNNNRNSVSLMLKF